MKKYRIFEERPSLYDHLADTNPYFHGLYQVVKVHFTLFLIYLIFRDSYKAGRLWIDTSSDKAVLGHASGLLVLVALEIFLLTTFVLLYPMFLFWKNLRQKMGVVSDILYFLLLCGYVVLIFYSLFKAASTGLMGGVPKVIACIECIRLIMKMISFVRENVYKVLYPWSKDDEQGPAVWYGGQMSPKVASFSQYMYFLVAPTLLYRDHYPRNKGNIKWSKVASYFLQCAMEYALARYLLCELEYPKSFKLDDIVEMYMTLILVSFLHYAMASHWILHAWFNFTSELTRFADRQFYLNWWSADGYSEFHRLWNLPIYDFTAVYIYGAFKPYVSKSVAAVIVFILSAFAHDLIIGMGLGLFLPVFLFLYPIMGGIVFVLRIKFSKYTTLLLTCCGFIIYQGIYFLESGARYYCPDPDLSYFSVHSLHCFQQHNNVTMPTWW